MKILIYIFLRKHRNIERRICLFNPALVCLVIILYVIYNLKKKLALLPNLKEVSAKHNAMHNALSWQLTYYFRECNEQPTLPIRLIMSAVTSVARLWEQEEDFVDAPCGWAVGHRTSAAQLPVLGNAFILSLKICSWRSITFLYL